MVLSWQHVEVVVVWVPHWGHAPHSCPHLTGGQRSGIIPELGVLKEKSVSKCVSGGVSRGVSADVSEGVSRGISRDISKAGCR